MKKGGKNIYDKITTLPIFQICQPFYKKYNEILLYLLFGGLAFLVNIGTYAMFNVGIGINELIANVISWLITVTFAFFTNRIWVFNAPTNGFKDFIKQMFSFFGGRVITLAIEELILLILITWIGMPSVIIKIVAQIVVIVINYAISKLLIFK